ncbi:MAG: FKBP-type peptidyl-prolyl cis-trans isomerase [Planctomycetota bacterium]|jgi:FKBP-type peptidyl-prolyl cis-trans isomerase
MKPIQILLAAITMVAVSTLLMANQEPAEAPATRQIPADTEIQTTESGLKYSVLQPGNGKEFPGFGDKVKVHYSGWLTDGTMFDSSYNRSEPTEFAIGQVIEGWNEGLALMSPGAKLKLTIPFDLAYGEAGRPPTIPAKSTLIFEVELIAITAKAIPYMEWSEERETITMENGVTYQVLAAGEGILGSEADSVNFDFARYDAEKKISISSSMIGTQVGPPNNPGIPFLKSIMGKMKPGSHLLIRVPKAVDIRAPGNPEDQPEITVWQIKLNSAQKFDAPEFSMPTAEELTTTASGLQYQILRAGDADGAMPTNANKCTVHYSGWLTNGTSFDSSYTRGQPATFGVTQVISGWTEGLKLMKTGAMYKFVIPGNLAYKERGSPPNIGPNATLVFVVELLSVQ